VFKNIAQRGTVFCASITLLFEDLYNFPRCLCGSSS